MAISNSQTVYSNGICHGLPLLGDDPHDLSAIVVGASGMSGQSMIDCLVGAPKRWSRIFALPRRPPQADKTITTLKHVPTDLLKEPGGIAESLTSHEVQA